jgi:RHS repeat-associated protein
MVDPVGRVTTYTYDASGEHLMSITDLKGTTGFTYVIGQGAAREHALQSITYPDSTHRYYEYDAGGRLSRRYRDGGTESVTFTYSLLGGVTATDAAENITRFLDYESGHLGQLTDPLGATTSFDYDQARNLISTNGPQGFAYSYGYDSRGNRTQVIDPQGYVISLAYGANARLTALTDTRGNRTQYEHDSNFNLSGITYPNGSREQFSYDVRGNLTRKVNRRGQAISFTYDTHNLLRRKTYRDGSQVDYTYDGHRNRITATDSTGTTNFTYDTADRLRQIDFPNGRFLHFTYDIGGRRTRLEDPSGVAVNYGYDPAGRLAGLSDGSGQPLVNYIYDAVGRLARKNMGNGTYTTYDYDGAGRLLHLINYAPGGSILSRFDYTYDALGRRTSMTTLDGLWTYQNDVSGQLTSITLPGGRTIQYVYDAAGNRMSVTDNGLTTNYTSNSLDQYLNAGVTAYTYDADGNLTSKIEGTNTWTTTYDDENRLTAMTHPQGSWSYEYDALGNRVASVRNGQRTEYLVDPFDLGNVVAEYGGSGNLLARYSHGQGLVNRTDASQGTFYFNFDGSSNTSEITSSTGGILNRYSYLPYGEKISSTISLANPFTFVGQFGVMDGGEPLYFMRNRWYAPDLGRFVQNDPLKIAGGDVNLYRYVGNSPVNFIDSSGLFVPGLGDISALFEQLSQQVVQQPSQRGQPILNPDQVYLQQVQNQQQQQSLQYQQEQLQQQQQQQQQLSQAISQLLQTLNETQIDLCRNLKGSSREQAPLIGQNPCCLCGGGGGGSTQIVQSYDPNVKITVGYGNDGFITDDSPILYTVFFENQESATAPAQKVVVTDQLSDMLDWSTVEFFSVGFNKVDFYVPSGLQHYETTASVSTDPNPVRVRADFNANTGLITWVLESVDPVTLGLPEDPLAGFLPPNNQASIVFDVNAPILTNIVTNTIDNIGPGSSILALPGTSLGHFLVSWAGNDDVNGSGIAFYDIYVSEDGGPFELWLGGTTATQAVYPGRTGHTYAFYSLAYDQVGHREDKPAQADASTITIGSQIFLPIIFR